MKKFLASGMFVFLGLCASLNAQTVLICDLKVYLKEKIYYCNHQLDDLSFDQTSGYAGYIMGQKIAYMDVLKNIED